jgi:hypothetical protein
MAATVTTEAGMARPRRHYRDCLFKKAIRH